MSINTHPPPDLPISLYLIKHCKLWVWDFDDTLINTETYLRNKMDIVSIRNRNDCDLDNEFPQWKYFKRLIEFLVTHGKYVAIASFGTYEIIRAYMDRVLGFNQKYFGKQNIIAPCLEDRDTRRFSVPPNKNEYIYQIMQVYRVQDFGRVVLFDDMPSNISSARSIGIISVQIATPNNGGNSNNECNQMYFGPWTLINLDNIIYDSYEKTNGSTVTTTATTVPKTNSNQSKATLVNTEPFLGDSFQYTESAYGTGIGDRKITKKSENRWNKMNVQNPPLWQNGNWQTDGGTMTMESYPESTLGGHPFNLWDNGPMASNFGKNNSRLNRGGNRGGVRGGIGVDGIVGISNTIEEGFYSNDSNDSNSNNDIQRNKRINNAKTNISKYNEKYKKNNNNNGYLDKFDKFDKFEDSQNCDSCKKITWNWITLSLMLIIFMMIALVFSIK